MSRQKIFYVGNYIGNESLHRNPSVKNYAGTMKMKFIIEELKKLGYCVEVVSLAVDRNKLKAMPERFVIDEFEEHYYVPYRGIRLGGRVRATGVNAVRQLYRYLIKTVNDGDIVIAYHAYAWDNEMDKLRKKKNIRLIKQVEEMYCLSHYDAFDESKLKAEEKMIAMADGYLMINEGIARKYGKGRPCAISYGNYLTYLNHSIDLTREIGLVYTGLVSEDRGAFAVIEAMKFLPKEYTLHILGFGDDESMNKMHSLMDVINQNCERVFFYGTKTGEEYTDFLGRYQIGLSITDTKDEIASSMFPSKILAYLGHSLIVVSSKSRCVVESKLKDELYFCEDNTSEKIAEGILKIPKKIYPSTSKILDKMETEFRRELSNVLGG